MNELTWHEREKAKYEKIWEDLRYRTNSPGYNLTNFFETHIENQLEGSSITDFGCGTGAASLFFLKKKMKVQLVDIADNALSEPAKIALSLLPEEMRFFRATLWDLPQEMEPTDWIYCIDVLEHLPEECVEKALSEMARYTKKGGLLQIYLEDEPFGETIGETLHLTLKPRAWWIEMVSNYWHITLISPPRESHVRFIILVGEPK